MSLRNVGTRLQSSAASHPTRTPFYCFCCYSGIKCRPFFTPLLLGHVCVHHSFVWSGPTFVLVFNSGFLSLHSILCSMLYTFYIISYCDFPGTPFFLMYLIIRHPFFHVYLLIRHPFLPCVSAYPAPLPALCISLSGTPSFLVRLPIRHPFLPCASPYRAPFLPCASPYPAPLHIVMFIRTPVDVTLKRIVFACQLACT